MCLRPCGLRKVTDRSLPSDTRSKPRQTTWSRSRALSGLRVDIGPDGRDRGRASQFDPAIDKERKLISNLRWNMLVLLDSLECVALRANVEGDRLNSRFQHTHKNKSVITHGRKIGYNSGLILLFRQILVNGNRMSIIINLC